MGEIEAVEKLGECAHGKPKMAISRVMARDNMDVTRTTFGDEAKKVRCYRCW